MHSFHWWVSRGHDRRVGIGGNVPVWNAQLSKKPTPRKKASWFEEKKSYYHIINGANYCPRSVQGTALGVLPALACTETL